jgi:hypothetical protein
MTDPYAQWRAAVAADAPRLLDVPPGVAVPGFYRASNSGQPVAVWIVPNGNSISTMQQTGATGRTDYADERWCERVFAYCEPVPEEAYRQAVKTGIWHDHRVAPHNRPPEGLEGVTGQLDDLRMDAEGFIRRGEAQSQADADAASNLVSRLQGCIKRIEEQRDAELAPLDERLREIDRLRQPIMHERKDIFDRYDGMTTSGHGTIEKLKNDYIGKWLIRVRQAAREALAATGAAPGGVSMRDGTTKIVTNAGAKGAKVTLVTRWWAEIENYDTVLAALKDHPEVRGKIQQLCDAAARSKAKIAIPGVKFHSEDKVR